MTLKPDATHDVCPKCGQSKLAMKQGETRTCPVCGHTWTRRQKAGLAKLAKMAILKEVANEAKKELDEAEDVLRAVK